MKIGLLDYVFNLAQSAQETEQVYRTMYAPIAIDTEEKHIPPACRDIFFVWEHPRTVAGKLGAMLGCLGTVFGRLGAVLGRLGASWRRLGQTWSRLGLSWDRLGVVWNRHGTVLERLDIVLGASWGVLERCGHGNRTATAWQLHTQGYSRKTE